MSRTSTDGTRRRPAWARAIAVILGSLVIMTAGLWVAGCDSEEGAGGGTTSSTVVGGSESGDVEGRVGEEIAIAEARVTVKALEATFQPAQPAQRLSGETPSAPDSGESFYQAYVRVENLGRAPVRVDALDFACMVGNEVVRVETTRSGPTARSLLKNTSLELILTFKATAGYVPVLLYDPPWYDGTIRVDIAPDDVAVD